MRNPPVNYLITLAIGGLVWFVASTLIGNYLGNNVALIYASMVEFVGTYRLLVTIGVAAGVLLCFVWFYYGSRPTAAAAAAPGGGAVRTWNILALIALIVAVVLVFVLVVVYTDEAFTIWQYAVVFLMTSLGTYLLFWLCSVLFSPRPVMNCMPPRR